MTQTNSISITAPEQCQVYIEEDQLRPPAVFRKSYQEITPYRKSAFGEVTLKKTKNGQRAQSGIPLECPISPKKN